MASSSCTSKPRVWRAFAKHFESSEKRAFLRHVVPSASAAINRARLVTDLDPGTPTAADRGCVIGLIRMDDKAVSMNKKVERSDQLSVRDW